MTDVSFVCSVNLGCCTGSDAGVLISISRGPTLKHGSINTERETLGGRAKLWNKKIIKAQRNDILMEASWIANSDNYF